jgi:hypothetical protein
VQRSANLVFPFSDDAALVKGSNFEIYREIKKTKKLNPVVVVRKRTIPTERPPLVGEVGANLCG